VAKCFVSSPLHDFIDGGRHHTSSQDHRQHNQHYAYDVVVPADAVTALPALPQTLLVEDRVVLRGQPAAQVDAMLPAVEEEVV